MSDSQPAHTSVLTETGRISQAWSEYLRKLQSTTGMTDAQITQLSTALSTATSAQTAVSALAATVSGLSITNQWAIGDYRPSAAASLGSNWLECNGAVVSQTTYATLYSIVGAATEAAGTAGNFRVPDITPMYSVSHPGPTGPAMLRWFIRAL